VVSLFRGVLLGVLMIRVLFLFTPCFNQTSGSLVSQAFS
jgi:hypothetical protein